MNSKPFTSRMDCDEEENPYLSMTPAEPIPGSAVNSLILDYYKKFGRKRDLEQYFSLSTAQNEVKDTSGTFWRKMKSENDSSDSGGKRSDSSQELCRISIRCSVPDPCSSEYHAKPKPVLTGSALLESLGIHVKAMEQDSKTKSESVSPPIITEEAAQDDTHNSDEESVKSYDNNSQKSFDVLDSSTNKPLSPTSSITSQRKLEWDSLADVGYANESDRKTSASSLSTLERLALKQQYSNNDTKLDSVLEPPTAHSTPLDENEAKSKGRKGVGKKSTKIYKKDVDYLEVNVPHSSENNPPQSINVNLTKHISFNVEKDGKITVDNIQKDVSVSPEKNNVEAIASPRVRIDKEMQTSLTKSKNSSVSKPVQIPPQKIPVLISLNTLRRQIRKKKLRMARRKLKSKKKPEKENIPVQEKSGEQLSEAESFEYMPGHMYNQNQLTANDRSGNTAGNKSSLESSAQVSTDSSKGSKHSFAKDLEKSIDILRAALERGGDDANLRKQLIKQLCQRLLKSKYRDDESSSDFLSGLSFSSKKLGLGDRNHTTTSTSDNSGEKLKRPKKSILRNDKFNAGAIASTSQSVPNLHTTTNIEKLVSSHLMKNLTTSNTDSDLSHKEKSSSDNVFVKTTSQELYQKYLDALKREDAYKQHLKDKEMFLKQKLVCSDSAIKPTKPDLKVNNRLKDLIKDLTRNNYDDGSGDASKLEGGPNSSRDYGNFVPVRGQRSHSVFTLSSGGNSDQKKKNNMKKRLQSDFKDFAKPGTSKEHYCCCPHHSSRAKAGGNMDSSVQVNIKRSCGESCERGNESPRSKGSSSKNLGKLPAHDATDDTRDVCSCKNKTEQDLPDNFMVIKCSRMDKDNQEEIMSNRSGPTRTVSPRKNKDSPHLPNTVVQHSKGNSRQTSPVTCGCMLKSTNKSSQTNFLLKMLRRKSSDRSPNSTCGSHKSSHKDCSASNAKPPFVDTKMYEATRCLQTEISINPRIPEPSLSDINIITDCAILISQHSRTLSKPSLTDVFSHQTQYTETAFGSSKSTESSETSKGFGELIEDENISVEKICDIEKDPQEPDSARSEKFTIPIQGTNMTLMVSIGSNERKVPDVMVGQCVGTEKSKVSEKSTSLEEECSKAVQHGYCQSSSQQSDENSNNIGKIKDRSKNPCFINTCLTSTEPTFKTYPKTSPVNERKPFRRVNTDTDNFGKCAPVTFNKIYVDKNQCSCGCSGTKDQCNEKCNKEVLTNHLLRQTASVEKETQFSEPNSPKCSCGCAGHIEHCRKNCDQRKKSLRIDSSKCLCGCSGDKDHCNEKCNERKNNLPAKCPCGCSGTVDKCNKNCNVLTKESQTCSCGCGGKPEDCKNNCSESYKNISTQCSCGCSGDKETCDKDCKERKNFSNKEREKIVSPRCSCGCDGNINNCKLNCEIRKKSLSSQCSCGCAGDKSKCSPNCVNVKASHSKDIGMQKDILSSSSPSPRESTNERKLKSAVTKSQIDCNIASTSNNHTKTDTNKTSDKCKSGGETEKEEDPILELIQNITKKYTKKDMEKSKRKKCFKEIMTVLNYLLDTDESTDRTDDRCTTTESSTTPVCQNPEKKMSHLPKQSEKPVCQKTKSKGRVIESSDCLQSTDMPGTSSDSATCKVLNKIKKECDRYHQKRCKIHSGKKCDLSSSTSVNCDQCKRVHHCSCRNHKCKGNKKCEKLQKKAVAYNLILQTSESISEDTACNDQMRQLQNVVVKVPSQRKNFCNVPFKEMCAKIENRMSNCSPPQPKPCRSKSLPNESEISSMEEFLRKSQACCTVREYLEQNRPDFIAKSSRRQDCMRIISNSRTNMRAAQRDLLSMRLAQLSDVNDMDPDEIRQLAKDLGRHMRQKRPAPKFISEREMKKHSENIYKSLPEVVQKKEEARKEEIKKTNLLMANIFKRNLQKKTLRGSVDISNYSPIIKI